MNKAQNIIAIKKILNAPLLIPRKLNQTEFDFIYSILKMHPQFKHKEKIGIQNIWIKKTIYNKNGFFIERIDGTTTDFSYYKCLNGNNPKLNVLCAFRSAIRPQIVEFRELAFSNTSSLVCPITNEVITKENCHVDHKEPSFKKLVEEFVYTYNINVDKIELGGTNQDNSMEIYFINSTLKKTWEDYHKQKALLQIVSAKGNLTKQKGAKNNAC